MLWKAVQDLRAKNLIKRLRDDTLIGLLLKNVRFQLMNGTPCKEAVIHTGRKLYTTSLLENQAKGKIVSSGKATSTYFLKVL